MAEAPPFKPGDRVTVPSFGVGTVRYCNVAQFQTGMWVGVQLDTPNGKNDGSVKGVKYFECPANYGLFVRPTQVQPLTGDAPPATPSKPPVAAASAPSTPIASAPATPVSIPPVPVASVIPKPTASVIAAPSTPSAAPPVSAPPSTPKAASPVPATTLNIAAPPPSTPKAAPAVPAVPAPALSTPKTVAPPLPGGGAPPPLPSGGPPPLPGESPGTPFSALTTSPELKRMLAELKELIEWKDKAQENIKGLNKQLAAANAQTQTLTQDLDKEKKDRERLIEKATREFEREKERITGASEKEKTELQEALTAAKEQLEMAQLDQQIEAEKANQLEKELEQLRGKLEVLEAQQPKNVTVLEGATENERMLIGQCERLKEALMKLRDISVVEKQEHEKKLAEITKRADEVSRLEEKIQRMDADMQKRMKEIEELKMQLDELVDAQRMVEELTEKNLNLEEYASELKDNIKELEQLKEMSEELEENQQLVEKRLRSELYAKEIQLLDVQTTLENTRKALVEQANTVEAFRFKVRNLERDLGEVRKREEEEVAQASELNEKSQVLLEQNLQLRNRASEQLRRELEAASAVLEARTARSQVSLMRAYLPDDLQPDWAATEAIALTERIEGKSELVVNEVKRAYKLFQAVETRSRFGAEEIAFAHSLCISMIKTGFAARSYWEVLNRCEPEVFLRLGSMLADLKVLESRIDALLKLISRDDLNEAYPMEELIQLLDTCNSAFSARAKGAVLLVPAWREYHSIALEMQHRISSAETLAAELCSACGISAEAGLNETREAAGACRSLTKTLSEARRLLASDHIRTQLTAASATLQSLVSTLNGSLAQLKDKIGLQVEVVPEIRQSLLVPILQAFANKDAVSETKLSAEALYELLVTAQLSAAHKLLVAAEQTIITVLATADTKETPDPTPAWRTRATTIRADIHSIPALRDRAEKAAAEVAERTKVVQQKELEAVEYARREALYTQRLEALAKKQEELLLEFERAKSAQTQQIKMYEDALEALRQEVASLENEGRELKAKLITAESKVSNAPQAARGFSVAGGASPAEVLSLKEALNAVLRENRTWRGQATLQDALFLPSPPKPTKVAASLPRADVASLSAQLSQLLAAPPMLSLTEKHGVKEWEAKWALRGEKLGTMQRRLANKQASVSK